MPVIETTQKPLDIADALRAAAERAANLLEQLDDANERMRSASAGVLPDGTPVEDMLEELKETKAREAKLHSLLRSIQRETGCISASAYAGIKSIRELLTAFGRSD